jgi:hypothetical protein
VRANYHSESLENLLLSLIVADEGIQPRAVLSQETITEYAHLMADGVQFPPVMIFLDGTYYWLADGFHRFEAAKKAGLSKILAEVKQGERRLALLHAVQANSQHGLPRTNADKRKAVEALLLDPEWGIWSNNEIARRCAVSPMTVKRVKDSLIYNSVIDGSSKRVSQRNGQLYVIDTAKIGLSKDSLDLSIEEGHENEDLVEFTPTIQATDHRSFVESSSAQPASQEFPTQALALDANISPDNTLLLESKEEHEESMADSDRQDLESEETPAILAQTPTLPLCIATIEWDELQPLEDTQTLRFPLHVWIEGPSTLLSTLFQQIHQDSDMRDLLIAELNDSITTIADLMPH